MTLSATNSTGETLLGSTEIRRGAVVLSSNSRVRAALGEAIVAAALQGLAAPPLRAEMTGELLVAQSPGIAGSRLHGSAKTQVPPDDARAIIHEHLEQQHRKVLDELIPVQDGRSPRQAARTAAGRVQLVARLKDIENHAATAGSSDPIGSYDFGWLWRELSVEKLRA